MAFDPLKIIDKILPSLSVFGPEHRVMVTPGVFVKSVFFYLLQPIQLFLNRAFREMPDVPGSIDFPIPTFRQAVEIPLRVLLILIEEKFAVNHPVKTAARVNNPNQCFLLLLSGKHLNP